MAAPSKTWSDIADDKIDVDSPANTELFTFMRDDLVHTDERVGIPANPGARQASHRHKGLAEDGSDFIELTPQENLIAGGDNPNTSFTASGSAGVGNIGFQTVGGDVLYNIIRGGAGIGGELAITKAFVSANIVKKIKSAGGKGRFTCSMHIKRDAAASGVVGGTLRFGIWDGSAFVTGAFVDIDFDDVTTEYKRFYFVSDQIARPTALNLRAEWTADPSDWDTINNGDLVALNGGYMVTNGQGIAKWDISHLDGGGDAYDSDSGNRFYWWDEAITPSQETV
jgi:hypothetical protein